MFERLRLHNFLCHKDATLDFDPGVNVIAGTSDAGKSAILKGLLWVLTNKPAGMAFRHWDCDKGDTVEAELRFDGHTVTRQRSETDNAYTLDGQKFVAMKTDVPKDIAAITNIADINIQTQFQPHFLLSATSGEVTRALNDACDLSVIDTTIKAVSGIAQAAKAEARAADMAAQEAQEQFEALAWVDEAEKLAEQAEQENSKLQDDIARAKALDRICRQYQVANEALENKRGQVGVFAPLSKLRESLHKLQDMDAQYRALSKLVSALEKTIVLTKQAGEAQKKFALLPKLAEQTATFAADKERLMGLFALCTGFDRIADDLEQQREQLADIQRQQKALWKAAEVCPLCGQPVGGAHD